MSFRVWLYHQERTAQVANSCKSIGIRTLLIRVLAGTPLPSVNRGEGQRAGDYLRTLDHQGSLLARGFPLAPHDRWMSLTSIDTTSSSVMGWPFSSQRYARRLDGSLIPSASTMS